MQGACQNEAEPPCERWHLCLPWSSLWGLEACEMCAEMRRRRHANACTRALVGAPYGATKRVRGVPNKATPPCERWLSGLC
eukprot:2718485-Pyramimonas_sp.AAC.1